MKPEGEAQGDDVQDVDYEEVSREMIFLNRVNQQLDVNRKLFKINVEILL
jgi:hypothetical protein